jgi:selenocysteine lyase/cysteine desulfurase
MLDLSLEISDKDRKNSRPTQTAHVQDITVQDRCKSTGFACVSGQQRSKSVGVVTIFDLARCVHRDGENPQDYLARWLCIQANLAHYNNDNVVYHFVEGLDQGTLLRHTLRR